MSHSSSGAGKPGSVSTSDAASYLSDILTSLAQFAHVSDLHNTSVMIAAASQLAEQESRLMRAGHSQTTARLPEGWASLFSRQDQSSK